MKDRDDQENQLAVLSYLDKEVEKNNFPIEMAVQIYRQTLCQLIPQGDADNTELLLVDIERLLDIVARFANQSLAMQQIVFDHYSLKIFHSKLEELFKQDQSENSAKLATLPNSVLNSIIDKIIEKKLYPLLAIQLIPLSNLSGGKIDELSLVAHSSYRLLNNFYQYYSFTASYYNGLRGLDKQSEFVPKNYIEAALSGKFSLIKKWLKEDEPTQLKYLLKNEIQLELLCRFVSSWVNVQSNDEMPVCLLKLIFSIWNANPFKKGIVKHNLIKNRFDLLGFARKSIGLSKPFEYQVKKLQLANTEEMIFDSRDVLLQEIVLMGISTHQEKFITKLMDAVGFEQIMKCKLLALVMLMRDTQLPVKIIDKFEKNLLALPKIEKYQLLLTAVCLMNCSVVNKLLKLKFPCQFIESGKIYRIFNEACKGTDVEIVKSIYLYLKGKYKSKKNSSLRDLDFQDENKRTPLSHACEHNCVKIVSFLISQNVDVNRTVTMSINGGGRKKYSPCEIAINLGHHQLALMVQANPNYIVVGNLTENSFQKTLCQNEIIKLDEICLDQKQICEYFEENMMDYINNDKMQVGLFRYFYQRLLKLSCLVDNKNAIDYECRLLLIVLRIFDKYFESQRYPIMKIDLAESIKDIISYIVEFNLDCNYIRQILSFSVIKRIRLDQVIINYINRLISTKCENKKQQLKTIILHTIQECSSIPSIAKNLANIFKQACKADFLELVEQMCAIKPRIKVNLKKCLFKAVAHAEIHIIKVLIEKFLKQLKKTSIDQRWVNRLLQYAYQRGDAAIIDALKHINMSLSEQFYPQLLENLINARRLDGLNYLRTNKQTEKYFIHAVEKSIFFDFFQELFTPSTLLKYYERLNFFLDHQLISCGYRSYQGETILSCIARPVNLSSQQVAKVYIKLVIRLISQEETFPDIALRLKILASVLLVPDIEIARVEDLLISLKLINAESKIGTPCLDEDFFIALLPYISITDNFSKQLYVISEEAINLWMRRYAFLEEKNLFNVKQIDFKNIFMMIFSCRSISTEVLKLFISSSVGRQYFDFARENYGANPCLSILLSSQHYEQKKEMFKYMDSQYLMSEFDMYDLILYICNTQDMELIQLLIECASVNIAVELINELLMRGHLSQQELIDEIFLFACHRRESNLVKILLDKGLTLRTHCYDLVLTRLIFSENSEVLNYLKTDARTQTDLLQDIMNHVFDEWGNYSLSTQFELKDQLLNYYKKINFLLDHQIIYCGYVSDRGETILSFLNRKKRPCFHQEAKAYIHLVQRIILESRVFPCLDLRLGILQSVLLIPDMPREDIVDLLIILKLIDIESEMGVPCLDEEFFSALLPYSWVGMGDSQLCVITEETVSLWMENYLFLESKNLFDIDRINFHNILNAIFSCSSISCKILKSLLSSSLAKVYFLSTPNNTEKSHCLAILKRCYQAEQKEMLSYLCAEKWMLSEDDVKAVLAYSCYSSNVSLLKLMLDHFVFDESNCKMELTEIFSLCYEYMFSLLIAGNEWEYVLALIKRNKVFPNFMSEASLAKLYYHFSRDDYDCDILSLFERYYPDLYEKFSSETSVDKKGQQIDLRKRNVQQAIATDQVPQTNFIPTLFRHPRYGIEKSAKRQKTEEDIAESDASVNKYALN